MPPRMDQKYCPNYACDEPFAFGVGGSIIVLNLHVQWNTSIADTNSTNRHV